MIMACRPVTVEEPICYTFAGLEGETEDARLAVQVAARSGLAHEVLRIGRDFFSNFAAHADRTIYITDGCFGVTGAHEIYLNAKARQLAPVRLTGNFGSELLRGMSTFKPLGLAAALLGSQFHESLNSVNNGGSLRFRDHPVSFAAFKEIPWKMFGSLAAGRSQVTFRTPYLDNEIVALAYLAPERSRRSARVALNLVRTTDPALGRIPTDRGWGGESGRLSSILRPLLSEATFRLDYLFDEGLPHWLSPLVPCFDRFNSRGRFWGLHKYLHYRAWFQQELATFVAERLNDAATRRNEFWNPEVLARMATDHINGGKNYVSEINAVLSLEAIERLIIRDSANLSKPELGGWKQLSSTSRGSDPVR
jgi:asparagine synthase (glutamine-hydrolysing)